MRISDWSSDVCSSDLERCRAGRRRFSAERAAPRRRMGRALVHRRRFSPCLLSALSWLSLLLPALGACPIPQSHEGEHAAGSPRYVKRLAIITGMVAEADCLAQALRGKPAHNPPLLYCPGGNAARP